MENEGNPIDSMNDGDYDYYVGGLSPGDAQDQIDNFMSEVVKDPNHAYMQKGNPKHKQLTSRVLQLRERVHSNDPDCRIYNEEGEEIQGTVPLEIQKIANEAMAEQENKQIKLVEQGNGLLAELRSLGHEGMRTAPDDVDTEQLDIWKMQIANTKGDYHALGDMVSAKLKGMRSSAEITQLYEIFRNTESSLDPTLKANISHQIISYLNDARKQRKAAQKNARF